MEELFHIGVKALIVNSSDDTVLTLRSVEQPGKPSYWDLPGGRMQQGETALEAVRRETLEETGLTITGVPQPIGMALSSLRTTLPDGRTAGLVFSIYACTVAAGVTIRLAPEWAAYEWVGMSVMLERLARAFPPELCVTLEKFVPGITV